MLQGPYIGGSSGNCVELGQEQGGRTFALALSMSISVGVRHSRV